MNSDVQPYTHILYIYSPIHNIHTYTGNYTDIDLWHNMMALNFLAGWPPETPPRALCC